MSLKSFRPLTVVTTITVSPTWMVSWPLGILTFPPRLMQAMRRSLFRFSWARGISVTSELLLRRIPEPPPDCPGSDTGFLHYFLQYFHSPHILKDIIGSNIFGIDHAAKIQFIYYLVKSKTVDLGNKFGLGNLFGEKRQKDVFFV